MTKLTLAEAERLFPDAICQMDTALGWMIHERDLTFRLRFYDPFHGQWNSQAEEAGRPHGLLLSASQNKGTSGPTSPEAVGAEDGEDAKKLASVVGRCLL